MQGGGDEMGDLNSPLVRDEKPVVEGGVGKKDEIQNVPRRF